MTPEEKSTLGAEAAAIEGEVIGRSEALPGPDAETAQPSTGDVLTMILRPVFDVLAPAWEVTDAECGMLGQAYGAVADKYFPNLDIGVELSALVATAIVFGPRAKKPRKVEPIETPPMTNHEPAVDASAPG